MSRIVRIIALLVSVSLFLAACGTPTATSPTTGSTSPSLEGGAIVVKGSDTMVNLASAWAEDYMIERQNVRITVSGGGSGIGIAAFLNKTADICNNSRPLAQEELDKAKAAGLEPVSIVVAKDGVSVVVHPSNPIGELSMEQLAAIFGGKITNWKELGGADSEIVVLSRDNNSGTYTFFKEHIVQMKDKKAEYGLMVQFLPTSQGIADEVARNPKAIGYVGLGYLSDKQKALAVKTATGSAVLPSVATVLDNSYPVSRPLFCTTNGQPKGVIQDYLAWILSPKGQEIVRSLDFVPIQ
ncbi:MAG: PstS family phosphate ABC transporter substrate-binding protein [Coprothermobacterota bacterium]|nr:PstS family phosphate ABC transporter substrate-binding protein [Coprothermobacterota bacterium]